MDLHQFLNRVRTLHCLDFHDLVEGGAFTRDDERWGAFRSNPAEFMIRADDETAAKIWAVAEKRSGGSSKREAA